MHLKKEFLPVDYLQRKAAPATGPFQQNSVFNLSAAGGFLPPVLKFNSLVLQDTTDLNKWPFWTNKIYFNKQIKRFE